MSERKALVYKRAPASQPDKDVPYEIKFANLLKLCKKAKAEGLGDVIVTWPWVIGDTYEEIIESLSRFADAGLVLHIVERHDPDKIHLSKVGRN